MNWPASGETTVGSMAAVSPDSPEWRLGRVVGKLDDGSSVQLAFGACSQPHSTMMRDPV